MRRPVLVALMAGSLLVACSEQPTEVQPPDQPPNAGPSPNVGPVGCSLDDLLNQVKVLFPPNPALNAVIAALKALPALRQQRLATLIKVAAFGIIDVVSRAYTAGKLVNSPDTPANLLKFITTLYCFTGAAPPPNFPTGPIDPNEFAIAVVTPTSGDVLVRPASRHGAIFIPSRSAPTTTTITVIKLPDSPGPLFTSLNQYPLFYEFSASPEVTFTKFLTAGVCPKSSSFPPSSTLRLAHNTGSTFGDVEILPPATAQVVCTDLAFSPLRGNGFMDGALASLAQALLPTELQAASAALSTTGVGGTLKHLSPFGSVDPGSNSGSILFNPDEETFTGLSAAPGETVSPVPSVKVTSKNGIPIANVPVVFAVTGGGGTINDGATLVTVTTDANGVASLDDWTLGPESGTNTLTATPPAGAQVGAPPAAYKPAVAFVAGEEDSFLTFSAEASTLISPLGCELEGSITSLNSDTPVNVTFSNQTEQSVSVFWLDFNGQRNFPFEGGGIGVPYAVLAPGQSYVQGTFVTHPWILIGDAGGEGETCYGIFLPLANGGNVIVP